MSLDDLRILIGETLYMEIEQITDIKYDGGDIIVVADGKKIKLSISEEE